MTATYMLDTNMVSYIVKGRSLAASARLLALKEDEVACVSAVTEAEIRYGLSRKPDAVALRALMGAFLAGIRVLSWGRDEAEAYGRVRARLERSGMSLGNMDMMIAAHAIAIGAILVTNDKAFHQVDDLHETVNWATDVSTTRIGKTNAVRDPSSSIMRHVDIDDSRRDFPSSAKAQPPRGAHGATRLLEPEDRSRTPRPPHGPHAPPVRDARHCLR